MRDVLAIALFLCGFGQLGVLIASALVPVRLRWREELAGLPKLLRQLYWVYGGYVVLSIVALGAISLACADELAAGGRLARAFCLYAAAFWGIRLCLQTVLDARPHLPTWWLAAGYHALTVLFVCFTLTFAAAAAWP